MYSWFSIFFYIVITLTYLQLLLWNNPWGGGIQRENEYSLKHVVHHYCLKCLIDMLPYFHNFWKMSSHPQRLKKLTSSKPFFQRRWRKKWSKMRKVNVFDNVCTKVQKYRYLLNLAKWNGKFLFNWMAVRRLWGFDLQPRISAGFESGMLGFAP